MRATPRTPRSCDGPRGSVSMRPLGLAGQGSLQARRALVSLASIVEGPVNNRCVSAPHDDMRRRRRESHGWRGLARSGRVVGPREGDGSLIDARLVALASINLGGSCHCKWASAGVSGRREEAEGGTRPCRDTAFTWCVWESPWSQCGQDGFVLLALACSAARRLGESAPRWPAGSPAQWHRPQIWICAGPRDPPTKPSRGWLWVVVRKPRLGFAEIRATWNKVTAKARTYWRGCGGGNWIFFVRGSFYTFFSAKPFF